MTPAKPPTCCGCTHALDTETAHRRDPVAGDPGRRRLIAGALAAVVPITALGQAAPATGGATRRPEPGDRLAFQADDHKEIKPADLVLGAPPTLAYPVDAATGKVLVSKANLLTVVRMKAEALKPASAKNAADGIVAFSAVCTHYGCPVTTLHPSQTQVVCNCHGSVFDACDRGVVTQGPATRRLAMLPLAVNDGVLIVNGKFDGPIGPPTT
jgi:rieske iron-sulfur protein